MHLVLKQKGFHKCSAAKALAEWYKKTLADHKITFSPSNFNCYAFSKIIKTDSIEKSFGLEIFATIIFILHN